MLSSYYCSSRHYASDGALGSGGHGLLAGFRLVLVCILVDEAAGLVAPKSRVFATGRQQLGVRALLTNGAVVEYHDAVQALDGGQTVGDHDSRAAFHEVPQRVLDELLGMAVEGRSSLVQYQDG